MAERFLFVGTRKQAQEAVKEEALRTDSYYVNERWLGGTLTNFKTIREEELRDLNKIEKMEKDGVFDLYLRKKLFILEKSTRN